MKIADGYLPKQKFSISLAPDLFKKVNEYCTRQGVHRSVFIENAIRKALEGKSASSFAEAPKTVRDIAAKHSSKAKPKPKASGRRGTP